MKSCAGEFIVWTSVGSGDGIIFFKPRFRNSDAIRWSMPYEIVAVEALATGRRKPWRDELMWDL